MKFFEVASGDFTVASTALLRFTTLQVMPPGQSGAVLPRCHTEAKAPVRAEVFPHKTSTSVQHSSAKPRIYIAGFQNARF